MIVWLYFGEGVLVGVWGKCYFVRLYWVIEVLKLWDLLFSRNVVFLLREMERGSFN